MQKIRKQPVKRLTRPSKMRRHYGLHFLGPVYGDAVDPGEFCAPIIHRARMALADRSAAQVQILLDQINWMLDQKLCKEAFWRDLQLTIDQLQKDGKDPDHEGVSWYGITDAQLLLQARPFFDIADQRDLPNATWPEYFAALALALVDAALEERAYRGAHVRGRIGDLLMAWHISGVTTMGNYAVESMEALTLAESLVREKALEYGLARSQPMDPREQISLHTSRAAIKRHAGTHALIRDFVAFYKSKPHKSRAKAAADFIADQPKERLRGYQIQNLGRTLTEALSKILSGKRRLPEAED